MTSREELLNDPADLWDAYCAETPRSLRSPQGAMAFAFDKLVNAAAQDASQGWKLVPIEPTQEMIAAAEDAREAYAGYAFRDVYAEMVNAAPAASLSSTGLPAPAPHAEVRATARDEMTAAALARIARANLSDPETDDLTVPLAVELAEVQFRLNYMENQYGKIAWDATAPQQDRSGK